MGAPDRPCSSQTSRANQLPEVVAKRMFLRLLIETSVVLSERINSGSPPVNPVESLRSRVDLIVMFAVREDSQFVTKRCKPIRLLWKVEKSVLDGAADRMHAHHLVQFRLVAGDSMQPLADELLDELRSRVRFVMPRGREMRGICGGLRQV